MIGSGCLMTMKRLLAGAVPVLLLCTLASCKRAPDLTRYRSTAPVILISIDTLRADRLPAYGYESVKTPAIDTFFEDSVVFDACYAHCPQTLPSHTCILTGQLPFEHGVRDNIGFNVKPDQVTSASLLAAQGFDTGGFVSSYVMRSETRLGIGFTTYDAKMKREKAQVTIAELQRKGEQTIALAREWVDGRDPSRRFFLFLHLYEPHTPYAPPEPYATEYAGRLYDGEIAYTDRLIGDFLNFLRDRDLYDRSIIIFTSDHGEGLGDHGESEHGVFIYNASIHVPLAIKFPENTYAGKRVATPVQHIDLLPTLLDFYGLPARPALQGTSLLRAMQGDLKRAIYSESLYPLYHFGWSELYALRDGAYEFVKAPKEEMYDLKSDAAERDNLASKLAEKAGQYRRRVDQVIAGQTIEAPAEMTPEELESLQALGYIGVASTTGPGTGARPDPKDKIHLIDKFRKGLHLHRKGDEAAAAAIFREIVDESPDMSDVLEQLGRSLSRLRRVDEAAAVLKRVAELRSTNPQSLMMVARIFWKMGRGDEALRYVDQSISVDASNAKAHELRGQILYSKKSTAAAVKAFDRALQIDPTLPMPYYAKGLVAMQSQRLDEALQLFRQAVDALSKREAQLTLPSLHSSIAYILARQGKSAEAKQEFQIELSRLPGNIGARIGLAQLLLLEGNRIEALGLFDDLHTNRPDAYMVAAEFLQSIGEPAKARQLADQGRRLATTGSGG